MPRARQWLRLLDRLGRRRRGAQHPGLGRRPRDAGPARSPLAMLPRVVGRVCATRRGISSRASDRISSCSCIPGTSTPACSARSPRLRRIPTVLDVFISLYDTVVLDRGPAQGPLAARARDPRRRHAGVLEREPGRRRHARARRLLRPIHAPEPQSLRGALGRRRRVDVRARRRSRRRRRHPLVSHVHPAARVRDRRARCRAARPTTAGASASSATVRSARRREELVTRARARQRRLRRHRSRRRSSPARSGARRSVSACSAPPTRRARVVPNKVFQCAAAGRPIITGRDARRSEPRSATRSSRFPSATRTRSPTAIRALRGDARLEAGRRARATFVDRFSDAALAPRPRRHTSCACSPVADPRETRGRRQLSPRFCASPVSATSGCSAWDRARARGIADRDRRQRQERDPHDAVDHAEHDALRQRQLDDRAQQRDQRLAGAEAAGEESDRHRHRTRDREREHLRGRADFTPIASRTNQSRNPLRQIHDVSITTMRSASCGRPRGGRAPAEHLARRRRGAAAPPTSYRHADRRVARDHDRDAADQAGESEPRQARDRRCVPPPSRRWRPAPTASGS